MLKKKLLTVKNGTASPDARQESKRINFVSKTAKALLMVILFAAVFLIAPLVLAQNGLSLPPLEGSGLATASLGVIVARIINAALGLLGLVALLLILYGGFLWMTAKGEAERVQKAKKVLIQAVIGLIIIITSFAIAQFIFFILGINPWGGAGGPGGPGGPGGGGGGGALGAGIIRSHYPARNARNVPRNTKIVITFKEPICVNTTVNNSFVNINNVANLNDDVSKASMIKIYPRPIAGATTPNVIPQERIRAYYTADKKTFTFIPLDYLGNDQTPTWYVVELTNNIKKSDCLTRALGGFRGYNWSFEVSTELDLTPPQITSVIPRADANPQTVARNTVIQINFNEAIDPTTLAGKLVIDGGGKTGALDANSYDLMTVKAGNDYVAGEFYFSNQYRTVEFITNDPCGINSCGNQVFCLPGAKDISVLVKAATLAVAGKPTALEKPELLGTKGVLYDGLVDMCSNSLDGNKDGIAQGPVSAYDMNNPVVGTGDNAAWIFNTNDLIDLIPPQVEARAPDFTATDFNPDADLNLAFDKILLFSSLIQEESLTLDQGNLSDQQKSSYWFEKNENTEGAKTTVIIKTSGLADNFTYNILANSGIKDITQNCFMPCSDLDNCNREATETPGQYNVGTPWRGIYPNCNLAQ